ncbi:MAG: hybrid sensor histidine kinase/response regulator [Leptolyngbyaceae cyanobacterium SL_7_1]|nr:hybrid sensor histidine kinase/response regulator [Leptolyngbyaceae cyanobacterium SL_7_1]
MELHGGTVQAFSEGEGRGATFTVELPLSRVASTAQVSGGEGAPADGQLLDELQILLIDAEFDSRDPLATQLERDGAEVIAVASAGDATEIIEHFNPSVLLVNISTLALSDIESISQLRAHAVLQQQPLTAIALTLQSSEEERLQALSMGFQVYLSKRTQGAELATVIAALVS